MTRRQNNGMRPSRLVSRATPPTGSLLLLTVGAACGDGGRPSVEPAAVDTMRGSVVLEIGEESGPDEYLFGSVIGVARDSLERIFVADAQASEVRAFGPDGRFLFRAARKGSGPGEVDTPCCLALDDVGRLWVRDGGNGRYQAYRLEAHHAVYDLQVRFQHGDRNFWAPLTFDPAGRLVDVGHTAGATPMSSVEARFHVALDGTLQGTELVPEHANDSIGMRIVERRTARGFARIYLYQPFGSVPLVAHGPRGAWATAASGWYGIRWVLPDGSVRLISRDLTGPPLSDNDVRRAERDLAADAERAGVPEGRLPFGIPERKAPLQALWFDLSGRLWVQLTPAAGEDASVAHVYQPSGRLGAVARWPRGVDLSYGHLDERVAMGVRSDSLDVQRVIGIAWSR